MSDDDFDDLDLHDDDEDEGYVRIKKDDLTRVRKAARKRGDAERELAAYKRQEAVRTAGIDGLSERQLKILAAEAGEDTSPENLRNLAVEFKWIDPPAPSEEQQQADAELDQQQQAAAIANGANHVASRTAVKPDDLAAWPVDKQMRLNDQHPDLYESALRGEPIDLPAGFA